MIISIINQELNIIDKYHINTKEFEQITPNPKEKNWSLMVAITSMNKKKGRSIMFRFDGCLLLGFLPLVPPNDALGYVSCLLFNLIELGLCDIFIIYPFASSLLKCLKIAQN